MSSKTWLKWFIGLSGGALLLISTLVVFVDPYMHFHKPIPFLYYDLDSIGENVNFDIIKHYDYDALVAGTSMCQNFKTSEIDEVFGTSSIKLSASGGTYREVSFLETRALEQEPRTKFIIRGLDYNKIDTDPDELRQKSYEEYLYDEDPFNDVMYLLGRKPIIRSVLTILKSARKKGGVECFDDYGYWHNDSIMYGNEAVIGQSGNATSGEIMEVVERRLSEDEKDVVKQNVEKNVLANPLAYPDTDFYYFITPYSIAYWKQLYDSGTVQRQIDIEEYMIQLIMESGCDNLKLFSFNNDLSLVTNLDNYKDAGHYGPWVNSEMLLRMQRGEYLLTIDNYQEYIQWERKTFGEYDYRTLY